MPDTDASREFSEIFFTWAEAVELLIVHAWYLDGHDGSASEIGIDLQSESSMIKSVRERCATSYELKHCAPQPIQNTSLLYRAVLLLVEEIGTHIFPGSNRIQPKSVHAVAWPHAGLQSERLNIRRKRWI